MPSRATSKTGTRAGASRRREGKKGKSTDLKLTPRMQLFLDTAVEFATRGRPIVFKDIAAACRIAANRPSKWMRNQNFRTRLTLALDHTQPVLMAAAHTSQLIRARDFLPAYQTQLRRLGIETPWDGQHALGEAPGAGRAQAAVVVNLGFPLQEGDRSSLPPPIMRDASGHIVPIPPPASSSVVVKKEWS